MKKLKQLQREWYAKLKDSGFDDIEYEGHSIKEWSSRFQRKTKLQGKDSIEAIEEYHRLAEHFLNDYDFASELEKVIWEYHANGLHHGEISKILKNFNNDQIPSSVPTIRRVIYKLRKKMFRMYSVHSGRTTSEQ